MLRAFLETELASDNASVELRVDEVVRRFGLPENYLDGGVANVRTVEVGRDTPTQHFDMSGFGETGVSTESAGLGARSQGRECLSVILHVCLVRTGMTPEESFDICFHNKKILPR